MYKSSVTFVTYPNECTNETTLSLGVAVGSSFSWLCVCPTFHVTSRDWHQHLTLEGSKNFLLKQYTTSWTTFKTSEKKQIERAIASANCRSNQCRNDVQEYQSYVCPPSKANGGFQPISSTFEEKFHQNNTLGSRKSEGEFNAVEVIQWAICRIQNTQQTILGDRRR